MMKHKFILLFLINFLFTTIGFGSWFFSGNMNSTGRNLSLSGKEVTVTIHNLKQSTDVTTTTTYSIPVKSSVVVDETSFISPTDTNGNTQKEKWPDVGSSYTTTNWDEKTLYYSINSDGSKTSINTHSASLGPEQIKNKTPYINVNEWSNVSNDSTWGDVWNVGYQGNNFYFYTNCDDSIQFKMKYSQGDIIPNSEKKVSEIVEYDEVTGNTTTSTIYERAIVRDTLKQERGKRTGFLSFIKYIYGYYYPTYQYRKVTTVQSSKHQIEENSSNTLKVQQGKRLSLLDLQIDNYQQYGYYTDANCTKFFDFSTPITTSTDIYVKYLATSSTETLGQKITSLTSGQTLNVYNQSGGNSGSSEGNNYDIFTDPYYGSEMNVCFMDATTIKTGVNVNLTYGNGETYASPIEGQITESLGNHRTSTDDSISTYYSSNSNIGFDNCATYIALGGDLTINGNLTIGAHIGGNNNYTKYSYIIGKYTCLDLYGHNIYVDGGTLTGYGLIIDSIGTGKIFVKNNGTLESTLTISDGRATRSMMLGIAKRQSPFTEYRFSYLQVPVKFDNYTTMKAYIKFDIGEFGIANFHINFIGKTDALFLWNDTIETSYVEYYSENKNSLNIESLKKNCYNQRNKFIFNANMKQNYHVELTLTISVSLGSATATVDFGRIDFPISPFVDIIVKAGNQLVVSSKMTFYPGSSLLVEEGSFLKFEYTKDPVTYKKTTGVVIPEETRHMVGGIMSYTNHISDLSNYGYSSEKFSSGIYSNATFWTNTKTGNIQINGSIEFDTTINTADSLGDCFYYLSGYMNLSEQSLKDIIANRALVKTYDMKAELLNGYLFSGTETAVTNEYQRAASYNLNPLISNGKGYIIDSQYSLEGTYKNGVLRETSNLSLNNGVIEKTSDSRNFFLYVDSDMYVGGSAGSNQSDAIDREITITETEIYDDDHQIIKVDSNFYAYYKGIFVPLLSFSDGDIVQDNTTLLNANLRKFMSNSQSTNDVNSVKYSNSIIAFSSQYNTWIFKKFAE